MCHFIHQPLFNLFLKCLQNYANYSYYDNSMIIENDNTENNGINKICDNN